MNQIRKTGQTLLSWTQDIGLLIIALATIIATGIEISHMVSARTVTLADLLLLFIYLEIFAMVAIYMDSGKLPVRMPLYIAIVAIARYIILDMKNLETWRILELAGAALIIALAILVIRYGHLRFPYIKSGDR
ncbi:MAG: phosphate-starvation-inducible PsiE family protein [Gammaproteobacteria bacterium]|nr:phosphate-starvation-inducible PsiE family protein [Gammaproteobacteria bacterium]